MSKGNSPGSSLSSALSFFQKMESRIGLRVVRGPNWTWGDQDGGEGHVGTVVEVHVQKSDAGGGEKVTPAPCVVTVQWDCGNRCRYRCGIGGKYDLRLLDSDPAGVKHPDVVCDNCGQMGITGTRWKCARCNDYDLCTECYMSGKHSLEHEFDRIDIAGVKAQVPPRATYKMREFRGTFVNAEVVPGHDLRQESQASSGSDAGRLGRVTRNLGKDGDNSRGFAEVEWSDNGEKKVYRAGYMGKVDLKCIDPSCGGYFYPDHLPMLGAPLPLSETQRISSGDVVKIELEPDIFKALQDGHGGWNDVMYDVVGTTGTVQRVLDSGDLCVQFTDLNVWTVCPEAVVKVSTPHFKAGDKVQVDADLSKVYEMLQERGEWGPNTVLFVGEMARVEMVYPGGDVMVASGGRSWVFSSQCLTFVKDEYTPNLTTLQPKLPSLLEKGDPSAVVAATATGDVSVLRNYLQQHPAQVNAKHGGKTALHYAAAMGDVPVLKTLLEFHANLDAKDSDENKPLHFSVLNGHKEASEVLVNAGADVNAKNSEGTTPLIIAARKGLTDILECLLGHPNIQLHEQDAEGNTALHSAVLAAKNNAVSHLIEGGADPTLVNFKLLTPIYYAVRLTCPLTLKEIIKKYPEHVNFANEYGYTLLHYAVMLNRKDIVSFLTEQSGCVVDARNDYEQTPLLCALLKGNTGIVEHLVECGASVNAEDSSQFSALHHLLMTRDTMEVPSDDTPQMKRIHRMLFGVLPLTDNTTPICTVVTTAFYLLQKGADMHTKSSKGHSSLDYCPYLATLMTIYAENTALFDSENPSDVESTVPQTGLLTLYGFQGLVPKRYSRGQSQPYGRHTSGSQSGKEGSSYYYSVPSGGSTSQGYGYQSQSGYGSQGRYKQSSYTSQSGHTGGSGGYGGQSGGYGGQSGGYGGQSGGYGGQSGGYGGQSGGYGGYGGQSGGYGGQSGGYGGYGGYGGQSGGYGGQSGGYGGQSGGYSGYGSGGYGGSSERPAYNTPRSHQQSRSSTATTSTHRGTSTPSSAPATSPSNTGGPEKNLCFLCDNVADVKFAPCGHSSMCNSCAPRAKRCPTCKTQVEAFTTASGEVGGMCECCHKKTAQVARSCGHKFCQSCHTRHPMCLACEQDSLD